MDIRHSQLEPVDKVKILILGDSKTGKSSIMHTLCHDAPLRLPKLTRGCALDVRPHFFRRNHRNYWIEFHDIGLVRHEQTRELLIRGADGAMLVHDITNRLSYRHLWNYLDEVVKYCSNSKEPSVGGSDPRIAKVTSESKTLEFVVSEYASVQIPLVVVGTKIDKAEGASMAASIGASPSSRSRRSTLAEECNCESIELCAVSMVNFATGSATLELLESFFDQVIERKFFKSASQPAARMVQDQMPFNSPLRSPPAYQHRDGFFQPPSRLPPNSGSLRAGLLGTDLSRQMPQRPITPVQFSTEPPLRGTTPFASPPRGPLPFPGSSGMNSRRMEEPRLHQTRSPMLGPGSMSTHAPPHSPSFTPLQLPSVQLIDRTQNRQGEPSELPFGLRPRSPSFPPHRSGSDVAHLLLSPGGSWSKPATAVSPEMGPRKPAFDLRPRSPNFPPREYIDQATGGADPFAGPSDSLDLPPPVSPRLRPMPAPVPRLGQHAEVLSLSSSSLGVSVEGMPSNRPLSPSTLLLAANATNPAGTRTLRPKSPSIP